MSLFWMGLLLVFAGGAMQGSWTLPQKFLRGWAWEKGWLVYSIAGMILFPWLLVALLIPEFGAVYAGAGGGVVARTALFGAGWGIGSVLFGLGIARVGMALGFAIIISLTAALGSVVPMAVQNPEQMLSKSGVLLLAGLAVVIVGVLLCARAGALKEGPAQTRDFLRGLAICVASGIASPMMSFAFAFGQPIADEAARRGADPTAATIGMFAVATTAGFLINAGYCIHLFKRNRSWKSQAPAGTNTLLAVVMGFLWSFGFFLYGLGYTRLGKLGPSLGWVLLMTVMVLVANFWGLATGEWRGAPRRARGYLGAGLAVMVVALAILWGAKA